MAYVESHQSLGRHPGILKLSGTLRITKAQAIGHLLFLLWWALEYSPPSKEFNPAIKPSSLFNRSAILLRTGNISAFAPAEISAACEWPGDANVFFRALKNSGWIDKEGQIQEWDWLCGKSLYELSLNRNRQKRFRERKRANSVSNAVTNTNEMRNGVSNSVTESRNSVSNAGKEKEENKEENKEERSKEERKEERKEEKDTHHSVREKLAAPNSHVNGMNIPEFKEFWGFYPRKIAYALAKKEWLELSPGKTLEKEIITSLKNQCNSEQWKKRKIIPGPDKWLREKRWQDELKELIKPKEMSQIWRERGLCTVCGGEFKMNDKIMRCISCCGEKN